MGTWAHKKCQTHKSDTSDSAAVWLNFYRLEVTGPLLVFLITNIWDSWSGIIEDKIEQAQCPNQRLAGAGVADCGAWHGVGGAAGEGAQEARWGRECRGDGKGERCLQWCDGDGAIFVREWILSGNIRSLWTGWGGRTKYYWPQGSNHTSKKRKSLWMVKIKMLMIIYIFRSLLRWLQMMLCRRF